MKLLILSVLSTVSISTWAQTLLYNDGATIKVQTGAMLYVEGSIQNTATGTIDNDGTIELKGDFINAGAWESAMGNPNILKFSGDQNSNVTSNAAQFYDVIVQKGNNFKVSLVDAMNVSHNLDFNATGANNNKLVTENSDLKMGATATITGYDADEYVATVATAGTAGMLQKVVTANGAFTFPVGDLTNYSPLLSTFTGTAYSSANLRARVIDLVNPNGHPNKPADAESFISRYWDIDAVGITTYANTLVGTYVAGDVNGTQALIKGAVYNGSVWTYANSSGAGVTVTGSTTAATSDFTGTNFFAKANLKVFLQGAYVNGTSAMTTTLPSNGTIAALMLTSPYGDGASVGAIPANVTDWVRLETRDPASPGTLLGFSSAFVKSDGTIVGLDGTSLPRIKNGLPTSIVGVVHRMHLSIRTPNAGTDVVNPTLIDFTLDTLNAFRNTGNNLNANMKQMADLKFVMWGANGNSNTTTRYSGPANDRDYLLGTILGGNQTAVQSNVYSTGDFNMNGVVRYSGPNNDRDFLLGQVLGGNSTKVWTQHF